MVRGARGTSVSERASVKRVPAGETSVSKRAPANRVPRGCVQRGRRRDKSVRATAVRQGEKTWKYIPSADGNRPVRVSVPSSPFRPSNESAHQQRAEAQRRARAPKWHACCERTVCTGSSAAVCQRDTDTRRRATNPAVRTEPPTSGPTALALSMSPVCAVASGRGGWGGVV